MSRRVPPIKFSITDANDRTFVIMVLGLILSTTTYIGPEVHPIATTDEYLAVLYGIIIMLCISPLLLKSFYYFLKKQSNELSDYDFLLMYLFCSFVILACGSCIFYLLVLNLNFNLDKSQPVTRYVFVEQRERFTYVVTDWEKDNASKRISLMRYHPMKAGKGDVMRIDTREGWLNLSYISNPYAMERYPITEFPEDTKFPISEEEFQKIHISSTPSKDKQNK